MVKRSLTNNALAFGYGGEWELSKREAMLNAKAYSACDIHSEDGLFTFVVVPATVGLSQLPKPVKR